MENGTPGYALSNMPPAATDFIMGVERPSQLDAWAGKAEPFKDDPVTYNAIQAGREALTNGAAKIRALSSDLTRSEPQRHEAGGVVSAKTAGALEDTQRILNARANAYQAAGDEALREAFPSRPKTNGFTTVGCRSLSAKSSIRTAAWATFGRPRWRTRPWQPSSPKCPPNLCR